MSEQEIKAVYVRMPRELFEKVEKEAKARKMTVPKFIMAVLEGTASLTLDAKIQELEKRIAALERRFM
ncbi:MAG: hypothetical protein IJU53_03875 [Thermoguttaceae bacterium]|nr:hypothetical protein [Thermoguttaceae bacterium]